jgi:hypothetical protein
VPRASGASCGAVRPTTRRFHASQAHRIRFLFPSLLRPAAGSFLLKQISSCAEARPDQAEAAPPARPHRHAPALRSPSSTAAIDREPHQPLGPHLGAESEWVRAPRGSGSRNVRISRRHRCLPLSESRNDPPHLPWNPGLIPSR